MGPVFLYILDSINSGILKARDRYYARKKMYRLNHFKSKGMKIGKGVNLPLSTWIDTSHCFLISIGDNCGFGEFCAILAHDAMPNEYIDATKIGKIKIHESCHFGMRTIILPGVEIGPRSIVGANSVVTHTIPPETVAAGNPAKVICSLEEYLEGHMRKMGTLPKFEYMEYSSQYLTPEKTQEMMEKLERYPGYVVGGYTAMCRTERRVLRTKEFFPGKTIE